MTDRIIDQHGQPNVGLPAVDQRADQRHRTVLQVAKLATVHGDELCILRNVSAGGLRAEVYCELAPGEPVEFELKTGRRVAGTVVWVEGNAIGVQFDRRVPILSYLAHQAIKELGRRVRAPRVHIGERGLMRVAEREFDIDILDASQGGMRIRTDRVLYAGGACQIVANGLGERAALIRWCRDGEVGLELKRPLAFGEFAAWRKRTKPSAIGLH
jgi:hypothetical protein